MRRGWFPFLIVLVVVGCLPGLLPWLGVGVVGARVGEGDVRSAAVAGRFYPGDPGQLGRAIVGFLASARGKVSDAPVAIIVPHAGYIYSGQIAADGFNQVAGLEFELVVILGTNHTAAGFSGVSIHTGAGYLTPLGIAEIDQEVAAELIAAAPDFGFDAAVHEREHSVEVQVPFVQQLFPHARIVTAIVGRPDLELCRRFGRSLAEALRGRKALIVASTDLSHYPDQDDAVLVDRQTLAAMAALDPERLQAVTREQSGRGIAELSTCACGEAPVLAALVAARELGATRGAVVSYANSGDAAVGNADRVVGYGAVVLGAGPPGADTRVLEALPVAAEAKPDSSIAAAGAVFTAAQRDTLLAFARTTIARYLSAGVAPLARDFAPELCRRQGAFVTIEAQQRLRGCIGHLAADSPLCRVVGAMALQAAFNDRRFPPLTADELDQIEIEISVLTPQQPVAGYEEIVVGRDGVVLRKSGRSAVYLPHVAVEQGWDRDTMLDHLAEKAGLATDSWRDGAEFLTFQAEVFSESGGH